VDYIVSITYNLHLDHSSMQPEISSLKHISEK